MISSVDFKDHDRRLTELRTRQCQFMEQNKRIRLYMESPLKLDTISTESELRKYNYELKKREDYTPIGFTSAPHSRLLLATSLDVKRKLYCRKLLLSETPDTFRNHLLNESLKLARFFSGTDTNNYFIKLYDIFCLETNTMYLFEKKFDSSCSLMHLIWNNVDLPLQTIKDRLVSLVQVVDTLNVCGVAHRFIRPENILVVRKKIVLTAMDMACVFHNATEDKPILQSPRLPINLENHLLDHLPPECFGPDDYDASNVDVWSIGTVACMMITGNNPFSVGDENYYRKWRSCWERITLPEELRTLLDDIFEEPDKRITIFDLSRDVRLSKLGPNAKVPPAYYRINLETGKNVDEEKVEKRTVALLPSHPPFEPETKHIYDLVSYEIVLSEDELAQKGYVINRDRSFGEEFNIFINDPFLAARIKDSENCLAKVFVVNMIPVRHRNILRNESGKIMNYLSRNPTEQTENRIHRLKETFLTERNIYMFFDGILDCKSIYHLFTDEKLVRPTNSHIKQWMNQLIDVIDYLYRHAISHRYIRPEFVFVENYHTIKLTHFDMACFVWNPRDNLPTLRHRGLQDEQEHLWDHLPPECFQTKYDSLMVDVWSFGVLLLFCLTQDNPFCVPHTDAQAQEIWDTYQAGSSQKDCFVEYIDVLNMIFVPHDSRPSISRIRKKMAMAASELSVSKSKSKSGKSGKSRKEPTASGSSTTVRYEVSDQNNRRSCSRVVRTRVRWRPRNRSAVCAGSPQKRTSSTIVQGNRNNEQHPKK